MHAWRCNNIFFFPLDPPNYIAFLNATRYIAEITVITPIGTPVIYLSVVIGNPSFTIVLLALAENDLVERVFEFPNGQNDEQYLGLTPDPGSNTITIATQIQYVDDPQNIRSGADPVTLPATFGMSIHLVARNPSTATQVERNVRAFVTVDFPPGEN